VNDGFLHLVGDLHPPDRQRIARPADADRERGEHLRIGTEDEQDAVRLVDLDRPRSAGRRRRARARAATTSASPAAKALRGLSSRSSRSLMWKRSAIASCTDS
jgi:hypothetical protein